MNTPKTFVPAKKFDEQVKRILEPRMQKKINGDYMIASWSNYASGIQALRYDANILQPCIQILGDEIPRPLSLKENIEARVNDYEKLTNPDGSKRKRKERLKLFKESLDSCTGIAYKSGSTKFKIIPVCKELMSIDEDYDGSFLQIDYDCLEGFELDSSKNKYSEALTKNEAQEHPAWRAVVEEDLTLLKSYTNIIYKMKKERELLYFWIISYKLLYHELKEMAITSSANRSGIDGENDFICNVNFVQIIPKNE